MQYCMQAYHIHSALTCNILHTTGLLDPGQRQYISTSYFVHTNNVATVHNFINKCNKMTKNTQHENFAWVCCTLYQRIGCLHQSPIAVRQLGKCWQIKREWDAKLQFLIIMWRRYLRAFSKVTLRYRPHQGPLTLLVLCLKMRSLMAAPDIRAWPNQSHGACSIILFFGVRVCTISRTFHGQTWGHLKQMQLERLLLSLL